MKKLLFALSAASVLAACQNTEKAKTGEYALIGKKAIITYPDFKAEVTYSSDSTLHWKTTANGTSSEGDEKIFYKPLNDHQYFLNWIEKDGFSVSQVIDLQAKKVTTFSTFADEKSERGKRESANMEGTVELLK